MSIIIVWIYGQACKGDLIDFAVDPRVYQTHHPDSVAGNQNQEQKSSENIDDFQNENIEQNKNGLSHLNISCYN